MDFTVPADLRVKPKEIEERYAPKPCWRNEKTMEQESDGDTHCNWCAQYSHQRIGGLENKKTSGDHPNYCIVEFGQLEETWCHSDSNGKPADNAGEEKLSHEHK